MSLKFLHALYVYVGSMLMREIFRDFRFQGWVELLFYQCFHFMKSREKLNFFFFFVLKTFGTVYCITCPYISLD